MPEGETEVLSDKYGELHQEITALRAEAANTLDGKIVTIMSPKGGQGKSFFAKELAWLLHLILVDLDWDGGRVSKLLGYNVDRYKRDVPLLDALEKGALPKLYRSNGRPDMVPGHPDFEPNQPGPEAMAKALIDWAAGLGQGLAVDTHPGGSESTLGAAEAADLIVVPVVFGTGELDAVEEALAKLHHLPLLLVPNMVPNLVPAAEARRLVTLATTYGVEICSKDSFVYRHAWMTRRKQRTVISAAPRFGENTADVSNNMLALAKEVLHRVAA
jgi:chromosome partitioning protein